MWIRKVLLMAKIRNVCENVSNVPSIYSHANYDVVNRVHWLRARAQRERWKEEFTLVGHEMSWTVRYYSYQSGLWNERRAVANRSKNYGAMAYAARKEAMWMAMATSAESRFKKLNPLYSLVYR
jgi:hypothetical protein